VILNSLAVRAAVRQQRADPAVRKANVDDQRARHAANLYVDGVLHLCRISAREGEDGV
jgi:hypothetical protein